MLELIDVGYDVKDQNSDREILKNINLKIDEKFVAITGPNGGGKSTLAKIIMGVAEPTSGKIILDGCDITKMSVTERARAGLAFAFQQPVKFKGITVRDLISVACGGNVSVSDACRYLSEVGLCAKEYVGREVNSSLSGGELKRIEIATVMARKSKISIFDEPEAGIDLWSFGSLIKVFENMQKSIGGSIIIISHQERILSIADRIIVISSGEVVGDGNAAEIMPRLVDGGVCSELEKKLG